MLTSNSRLTRGCFRGLPRGLLMFGSYSTTTTNALKNRSIWKHYPASHISVSYTQ